MSGLPALRIAVPADAPAIARVHVESFRAAYAGLMPAAVLDAFTVEKRELRWEAILTRDAPEERTFIVAPDRIVAGFVSTGPSRDEGEQGAELPHVRYRLPLGPPSGG